jgi:hypothetical protein
MTNWLLKSWQKSNATAFDATQLKGALQQALALWDPWPNPGNKSQAFVAGGVNGWGKNTTIGKLANYFQLQEKAYFWVRRPFRAAMRGHCSPGVSATVSLSLHRSAPAKSGSGGGKLMQ